LEVALQLWHSKNTMVPRGMNALAKSPWPLFLIFFTVNSGANIGPAFVVMMLVVSIVYNLSPKYKQKEKPFVFSSKTASPQTCPP
jgi:hypothetical protein